jgi:hypothetical protein
MQNPNITAAAIAQVDFSAAAGGGVVRSLKVEEFWQWERLVQQSLQGTLFHSHLWLDALKEPHKLFGWFRGGELHGGFAVGLIGPRKIANPMLTPYLGVIFPKFDAKYVTRISAEIEIATAFAKFLKSEFESVYFHFPPEVEDLRPFIWEGFQTGLRYTYRLSLKSVDSVLTNMDKKCRRDLASAKNHGVEIEINAPFTEVLRLCEKSRQRQGTNTSFWPAAERVEIALRRAGHCQGFLARNREHAAIAAVWIVWDEKRAYYLLAGYDDSGSSSNAVALALWRAIQYTAMDLKLPEFDFVGANIPSLERFFRKFGGTLKPMYTISHQKANNLTRRIWRGLIRVLPERSQKNREVGKRALPSTRSRVSQITT